MQKLHDNENLMYRIMTAIYKSSVPIDYKGSMVLRAFLTKKDFVGHINIINNTKDLIFTIPHEQGISVYVDGKKAKTMTKMNIF